VGKVGLVANVNETQQGEELVHGVVAIVDPEVLEALRGVEEISVRGIERDQDNNVPQHLLEEAPSGRTKRRRWHTWC